MSSTRMPRRSTRSQSRGASVLSTDSDVIEVSRPVPKAKPRPSTRRIKRTETIIEDDVTLTGEASEPTSIQIVEEVEDERGQETDFEEETQELLQEVQEEEEVNGAIESAPSEKRPNRLRQRILRNLRRLVHILPTLPPILVTISFILAALALSPSKPFARKVYVDENALQPGSATVEWGWSQVNFADKAADRVAKLAESSAEV
jgi:hypothetical protein